MQTIEIEVFEFSELEESTQQKIMDKYYEDEDYPMLSDGLIESLKKLLKENGIEFDKDDIELQYSLGCCQGDGLCFTGSFNYKGNRFIITHKGNYYHSNSTWIEIENDEEKEIKNEKELLESFKEIYQNICHRLEKEGYSILEYRPTLAEFGDLMNDNLMKYHKDGRIFWGY